MQLLKISDQIESIVEVFSGSDHPIIVANSIQGALNAYSGSLTEWATQVAQRMVVDASDADYGVWLKVGKKISRETRKLLKESGTGDVFKKLQSEQVDLIKSLPLEASQKVHEWTKEGLSRGDRFEDIAKRIRSELGDVTRSRAICIARTETARARTNFTQARAKNIGSPGYIWHTVGDGRVRPMHADLDGTYHDWSDPPVCDIGSGGQPIRAHPGCVFNCRCWPEPVWPKSMYEK